MIVERGVEPHPHEQGFGVIIAEDLSADLRVRGEQHVFAHYAVPRDAFPGISARHISVSQINAMRLT